MAENHPVLSRLLCRASIEDIQGAQTLIRTTVFRQASNIPKNVIKTLCRVTKFDQFYDYLQFFLEEFSGNMLSLRFTHEQK